MSELNDEDLRDIIKENNFETSYSNYSRVYPTQSLDKNQFMYDKIIMLFNGTIYKTFITNFIEKYDLYNEFENIFIESHKEVYNNWTNEHREEYIVIYKQYLKHRNIENLLLNESKSHAIYSLSKLYTSQLYEEEKLIYKILDGDLEISDLYG